MSCEIGRRRSRSRLLTLSRGRRRTGKRNHDVSAMPGRDEPAQHTTGMHGASEAPESPPRHAGDPAFATPSWLGRPDAGGVFEMAVVAGRHSGGDWADPVIQNNFREKANILRSFAGGGGGERKEKARCAGRGFCRLPGWERGQVKRLLRDGFFTRQQIEAGPIGRQKKSLAEEAGGGAGFWAAVCSR